MKLLKEKIARFGHRNRIEKEFCSEAFFARAIAGPPVSVRYIQALLPDVFREAKLVLDAGCGIGECIRTMSRHGKEAMGIDISPFAARTSKQILGDISKMPFKDAAFDGLVAFEVIEHLDSRQAILFLRECHRIMKDNGKLAISTPNWLPRVMLWLRGISDFTHKLYFNPITIRAILKACGFDDLEVTCDFELKRRIKISLRGISLLALLGLGIVAVSEKSSRTK
jgi:2-polyprenyl-3-methyl-5-hydroxy-6-metoxy-1,4-benzoquinol methylase